MHRVQHAAAVQKHFGDQRHRQLRWSTYIKRQKAYASICKDITGGNSNTVVAYGDANFSSSCCKGNPSTPTVSLRRALGRQCRVYDTEEFRMSRLCCACNTAMNGMKLPLTGNDLPVASLQGFCFACTLHAQRLLLHCCGDTRNPTCNVTLHTDSAVHGYRHSCVCVQRGGAGITEQSLTVCDCVPTQNALAYCGTGM